jgi:5'-nucleotidase
LHFNDVYNIEGKDGEEGILGGAHRFKTALDKYKSKDKLVIFSGDLFFPSILSSHFEGK